MDANLQSQLDRVETALNTLIDSITSYNPSITAATDLLAADDQLNQGVKQLKIHQANHVYILQLRETANALNQTITTNMTRLAEIRKEILATPATAYPPDRCNVPYTDLLDYAKRISKYTVPPTLRPPIPASEPPDATTTRQSQPAPPPQISSTNGAPANDQASQQPLDAPFTNAPPHEPGAEGIGVSSLDQQEVQWLDQFTQTPFVPWPSEDIIRQGALAQIQVLIEQGIDPTSKNIDSAMDMKPDIYNGPSDAAILVDQQVEKASGGVAKEERDEAASGGVKSEKGGGEEEKPRVFGGLDLYVPEE